MSTYVAIIASIMMLATNAAWGRDRAAVLTGVDQTAAYGTPADNGNQATWADQGRRDGKTLNSRQTSDMPGAPVVLTATRGGGRDAWGRGHDVWPRREHDAWRFLRSFQLGTQLNAGRPLRPFELGTQPDAGQFLRPVELGSQPESGAQL